MRRDPVFLVFPPWSEGVYGQIYPALPVLAGELRARGARPVQLDLNALALEALARSRPWRDGAGLLDRRIAAIERRESLDAKNLERYYQLVTRRAALAYLERVASLPAQRRLALPAAVQALFPDGVDGIPRRLKASIEGSALGRAVGGRREKPLFACVTVAFDSQLDPGVRTALWIKKNIGIPAFLGGPLVSLLPPPTRCRILAKGVDGLVAGEGEAAVGAILDALRGGRGISSSAGNVPNLSVLDRGGRVSVGPSPPPALSDMACPWYDKRHLRSTAVDVLSVVAGRRCGWGRCAYCDYQGVYARREERPAEDVVGDIRELVRRHGVYRFDLVCDTLDPGFAARFSSLLVDSRAGVRWTSFIRADDRFTGPVLNHMRQSGCARLTVGLESLDDGVLRRVRKGYGSETALAFLSRVFAAGIPVVLNVIPDLPGTTLDSARGQCRKLEDLVRSAGGLVEFVSVFPFVLTSSSAMGRDPAGFGLVASPSPRRGAKSRRANAVGFSDPAGMTDQEKLEAFAMFRRLSETVTGEQARGRFAAPTRAGTAPAAAGRDTPPPAFEVVRLVFDAEGRRAECRAAFNPTTRECWRVAGPG